MRPLHLLIRGVDLLDRFVIRLFRTVSSPGLLLRPKDEDLVLWRGSELPLSGPDLLSTYRPLQ